MKEISKLRYTFDLLSPKLRDALSGLPAAEKERITELRLRRGRAFSAVLYGKEYFICESGRLMNEPSQAFSVGDEDIKFTFSAAFKGSVHAYPREISQGFITVSGGSRVGFCGTAVCDVNGRELSSVKNISSVNIRVAREMMGCSDQLYDKAFSGGASSLIIASPPCGGKTTVLRDLCRRLGQSFRVSVIDERGELACVHDGIPQNDIGSRCDVFDGYPKADAIMTAVRVLSPEIIVCDEIGSKSDLSALEYAVDSGVKLVCTCHASNIDDLKKRQAAGRLIKERVFDSAAILGTGSMCGKLTAFYRLSE